MGIVNINRSFVNIGPVNITCENNVPMTTHTRTSTCVRRTIPIPFRTYVLYLLLTNAFDALALRRALIHMHYMY